MNPNIILVLINTLLIGCLYTQTEQSVWSILTIILFISVLFKVIQTLFESYIFIYILAVQAVLTWLVTPLLSYNLQNIAYFKKLYKLWVKFMPVKQDFFYEFMFPATLAMLVGLWFVLRKPQKITDVQLPLVLREALKNSSTKPFFVLIGIGVITTLLRPLLGGIGGLGFILYLFSDLMLIGGMYLYYSPDKRGGLYLFGAFFFRFIAAAAGGMFGELIFGLVCYLSILTIGYRARLVTKIAMVGTGIFLILVLQAAKGAYRTLTWFGNEEPSLALLTKVYVEEASNPTKLLKPELLFTLTTRFNQGQLTALVLHDVPRFRPYQNGAQLLRVASAIFVPRLLWADKPMMGGKANIEMFTIYKLDKGTAMNIAPIGEAFGNFGRNGGIIFMFFYGWLIGTIYKKLLDIAQTRPGILVWMPSLMLYTVVVETDCISVFNGLFKQLFFIYFIYRLFKYLDLDILPTVSQEVIETVVGRPAIPKY